MLRALPWVAGSTGTWTAGLMPYARCRQAGHPRFLSVPKIIMLLQMLIQMSPQDLGYQRSRWSTELFAIEINRLLGLDIAASTLRRWLPREGIVWRRVAYVSGHKKNSSLFITLLLDKYVIHKSRQVQAWLAKNPKFILLFQPVYSPWINKIELLWHKLHETVTRNHQCRSIWSLLQRVRHFMDTVSPFPGSGYGTARM